MSDARRNFLVVWCSNFITSVGMMGFIPNIPLYLRELGVSDEGELRWWSGAIMAAAPLSAAVMGPVWGALGDRWGRKLMILRANAAIVLFVGAMAAVHSPWTFLLLRLGQGVFSGFIAPAMTLVSVATPPERQGRTVANLQTAVMAGSIAGPMVGGSLAGHLGHRAVFLVCAANSLFALLLVAWLVVEPLREGAPAAGDAGGAGGIRDEGDEPVERAGGGGRSRLRRAVALMQGIARDTLEFLGSPVLRVVLAGAFAVRFGSALVDPVMALWVETRKGFAVEQLEQVTGYVFGAQAAATLIFTPLWGRVGERLGNRRLLAICSAGAGLSYLAQWFAPHVLTLAVLRFLSGAFVSGVVPAAFSAAARNSPSARRGAAHGVTFSVVVLAGALAPLFGGALAATVDLGAIFLLSAALMLVTAWASLRSASAVPAAGAAGPSGSA